MLGNITNIKVLSIKININRDCLSVSVSLRVRFRQAQDKLHGACPEPFVPSMVNSAKESNLIIPLNVGANIFEKV